VCDGQNPRKAPLPKMVAWFCRFDNLGARLQTLLQEYNQLSSIPGGDAQTYRVLYTMFPVQRIEDRDP
jgi:hypothetical protein